MPDDMELESAIAAFEPAALEDDRRPGTPSGFACPDCGGSLWEIEEGELVRFRCRVGHAWTANSLRRRAVRGRRDGALDGLPGPGGARRALPADRRAVATAGTAAACPRGSPSRPSEREPAGRRPPQVQVSCRHRRRAGRRRRPCAGRTGRPRSMDEPPPLAAPVPRGGRGVLGRGAARADGRWSRRCRPTSPRRSCSSSTSTRATPAYWRRSSAGTRPCRSARPGRATGSARGRSSSRRRTATCWSAPTAVLALTDDRAGPLSSARRPTRCSSRSPASFGPRADRRGPDRVRLRRLGRRPRHQAGGRDGHRPGPADLAAASACPGAAIAPAASTTSCPWARSSPRWSTWSRAGSRDHERRSPTTPSSSCCWSTSGGAAASTSPATSARAWSAASASGCTPSACRATPTTSTTSRSTPRSSPGSSTRS